jgi:hypothetical protein
MGEDAASFTHLPMTQDRAGVVHISHRRKHNEEIAPGGEACSTVGKRPGGSTLGYIRGSAFETKIGQAGLATMANQVAEAERTTLFIGCSDGGVAVIGDAECVDEAESSDVVEGKKKCVPSGSSPVEIYKHKDLLHWKGDDLLMEGEKNGVLSGSSLVALWRYKDLLSDGNSQETCVVGVVINNGTQWNQDDIREMTPEALAKLLTNPWPMWFCEESNPKQEQTFKVAPEALAKFSEQQLTMWKHYEKGLAQEQMIKVAPEALENFPAQQLTMWNYYENCQVQEQINKKAPAAMPNFLLLAINLNLPSISTEKSPRNSLVAADIIK